MRDAPTDVCELRLEAQHALDELWDPLQLGDQSRVLIDIESAAHVSEMQSEQEAARHLADEGLGGSDGDLRACVHVQHAIGLHRER